MNQIFYFHRYPIYRSETKSNNLKLINSLTFNKNPIEISTQPKKKKKKERREENLWKCSIMNTQFVGPPTSSYFSNVGRVFHQPAFFFLLFLYPTRVHIHGKEKGSLERVGSYCRYK